MADPRLEQLYAALNQAQASPTQTLNNQAARLAAKREKLNQATQLKIQRMQEATQAWELSQTLKGQLLSLGTDNPYVRETVGSLIGGTGTVIEGAGHLTNSDTLRNAGQAFEDVSQFAEASQDTTYKARRDDFMPTGDLSDPSTWQGPKRVTVEGIAGNLLKFFGQMAPVVVGSLASGPGAAAALGGLQVAGDTGGSAYDRFMQMDDQTLEQVPYFQVALKQTKGDKEAARKLVAEKASQASAAAGALVGALGGAATGKLMGTLDDALLRGGSLTKAIGTTIASATEEGTQEVLESVAGRTASNLATGDNQNVTEGTLTDFAAGALGGSGITAAREVAALTTGTTDKEIARKQFETELNNVKKFAESNDNVLQYLYSETQDEAGNKKAPDSDTRFNRVAAVTAHLMEQAQQKDKKKADQAVTQLEELMARIALSRNVEEQASNNVDVQSKLKKAIAKYETKYKEALEAGDEAAAAKYKAAVLKYERNLAGPEFGEISKKDAQAQKQYSELVKRTATFLASRAQQEQSPETQQKLVETAQEAVREDAAPEVKAEKAKEAVTLLMESPDALDPETVSKLASDESNGLDSGTRTWLRTLSKAHVAANKARSLSTVESNIFEQGEGSFRSLPEYTEAIRRTLKRGNPALAQGYLKKLSQWAVRHEQKAKAVEQAITLSAQQGRPVQVLARTGRNGVYWEVNTGPRLSKKHLRDTGSLEVSADKSSALADQLKVEAETIRLHLDALKQEYKLRTRPTASEVQQAFRKQRPVADVQDAPKQQTRQTEQAKKPEQPVQTAQAEQSNNVSHEASEAAQEPVKPVQEQDTTVDAPLPDLPVIDKTAPTVRSAQQETQQEAEQPVEAPEANVSLETPEKVSEPVSETGEATLLDDDENASEAPAEALDNVFQAKDYLTLDEIEQNNLIKAWFKQNPRLTIHSKSEDGLSVMNALRGKVDPASVPAVKKLLSEDPEIQKRQRDLFKVVDEFVREFTQTAGSLFQKQSGSNKRFNLPQEFLVKHKSREFLHPAVMQAMGVAVYAELVNISRTPVYQGVEQIRESFNANSLNYEHPRFNEVMKKLQWGGVSRYKIIDDLGQSVRKVLGYSAHSKTPFNMDKALTGQLGALAYAALHKMNLLETTKIPLADMQAIGLIDKAQGSGNKQKDTYKIVRLSAVPSERNAGLDFAPQVRQWLDSAKQTDGILDKLLQSEEEPQYPTDEVPKIPSRIKGTLQKVPRALMQRLKKAVAQKHYLRKDWADAQTGLLTLLDDETLAAIGEAEVFEPDAHLPALRDSLQGKRNGVLREIENLREFVHGRKNDLDKPFYLPRVVWSVQRVGISSTVFNPQSSKLQRHSFKMDGWEYDVPTTETSDNALKLFKLSVLAGLGVKVDKMNMEAALKKWVSTINNEKIRKGVDVLKEFIRLSEVGAVPTGEQRAEMNQVVAEAAKEAGEGYHSLDALWQLAQYEAARDRGEKTFKATLAFEADGVNNGPILSLIMAGIPGLADYKDWGMKGGFFRKEDGYRNAVDFAANPVTTDLYESGAKTMTTLMQAANVTLSPFWESLTGKLTNDDGSISKKARNLFKKPSTELSFGSGIKGTVQGAGLALLDAWFEKADSLYGNILAQGHPRDQVHPSIQKLYNGFERATGYRIPYPPTLDGMARLQPKGELATAFLEAYQQNLGQWMHLALETVYEPFLKVRNSVVKLSNAVAETAAEVFAAKREALIKQRIAEGKLATNEKGVPVHDLLREDYDLILREMQEMLPINHTANSKGGSLTGGIAFASMETRVNSAETDNHYRMGYLVTPFKENTTPGSKAETIKRIPVHLAKMGIGEAGVRAFVTWIHSFDSAIASSVYQDHNILNVHDAFMGNPLQAREIAKEYNRQTYQLMIENSVLVEMMTTSLRTLRALQEEPALDLAKRKALYGKLSKVINQEKGTLDRAYRDSQNYLSEVAYVNQYGFEDGYYEPTDEERQAARNNAAAGIMVKAVDKYKDLVQTLATVEAENSKDLTKEASADAVRKAAKISQALRDIKRHYLRHGNVERALQYAREKLNNEEVWRAVLHKMSLAKVKPSAVVKVQDTDTLSKVVNAMLDSQQYTQVQTEALRKLAEKLNAQENLAFSEEMSMNAYIESVLGTNADVYSLSKTIERFAREYAVHVKQNEMGVPVHEVTADLVNLFEANPDSTFKEIFPKLYRFYRSRSNSKKAKIELELLRLIGKVVPGNMPVRYITPENAHILLPEGTQGRNFSGFYHSDGNVEYIGVMSPDFKASNLTPEMLLHELLHAATHQALKSPDARTRPLVRNLDNLRKEAEMLLSGNADLKARYDHAVANLDEFVAWGMTNTAFQRDVLAKIQVSTDTLYNTEGRLLKVLNGLQALIKNVVGLLLHRDVRNKDLGTINAAQAVIVNGAGLLNNIVQLKPRRESTATTLLMEEINNTMGMDAQSVLEVLARDAGLDRSRTQELSALLHDTAETLLGSAGAMTEMFNREIGNNPVEAFQQMMLNKELPLQSSIGALGVKMSAPELFVAEQLDIVLQGVLKPGSLGYQQFVKLFNKARKILKPKDLYDGNWDALPAWEKAQYEDAYNRLFSFAANGPEGHSAMLSRFGALVLVYPPLKKALNFSGSVVEAQPSTMGGRIAALLQRALDVVVGWLFKAPAQAQANKRIRALVAGLVLQQKRHAQRLLTSETVFNRALDSLEEAVADKALDTVARLEHSSTLQRMRLAWIGRIARWVREGKTDEMIDAFQVLVGRTYQRKSLWLRSFINELKLNTPDNQYAHDLVNQYVKIEQDRQLNIETMKQMVNELVGTTDDATQEAMTKVILKTDLSALLEHMRPERIMEILQDPDALTAEIRQAMGDINELSQNDPYYVNQAYALGFYMATGISKSPHLLQNAYAIVNKIGMNEQGPAPDVAAQLAKHVDKLTTLVALQYTSQEAKTKFNAWFNQHENAEQAVEGLMKLHRRQKREARVNLFQNDPEHMIKGYIKEIFDPYISVVVVSGSEVEHYRQQGYQLVRQLVADPADPASEPRYLMRHDSGGLARYNTGAFALTDKEAKGSSIKNAMLDQTLDFEETRAYMDTVKQRLQDEARILKRADYIAQFDTWLGHRPVPLINHSEVIDYRYMADEFTRDTLMNRNLRIADVMGAIEGSLYDKQASANHNKEAVRELKAVWDRTPEMQKTLFVNIGPDAEKAEYREIWARMPEDTRHEIQRVWGPDGMMVQEELVHVLFGYRDYRISQPLTKDEAFRNTAEDAFARFMQRILGDRAIHKLNTAQRIWEQVVSTVKDIYVIRNLKTLWGNIISNHTILWWSGVPMYKATEYLTVGLESILQYQKDHHELVRLLKQREAGILPDDAETAERIAELEAKVANNPVKPLIDKGQFPTILEDLDNVEEPFKFKSPLEQTIDRLRNKLPGSVNTAVDVAFVNRNTSVYKLLFKSTQLSDFVYKFALYKHLTEGLETPMSDEEAQHRVRNAFVNYNILTNPVINFLEKTGLLLFTRYFMRIQKVIMMLGREKPLRAIMLALADRFFGGISDVQDSFLTERLGNNPFHSGALEIAGAWDEPIVLNTALKVF